MSNVNLELQAMTDLAADRFRLMNNALATIKELEAENECHILARQKDIKTIKELEAKLRGKKTKIETLEAYIHATKEDV